MIDNFNLRFVKIGREVMIKTNHTGTYVYSCNLSVYSCLKEIITNNYLNLTT